MANSNWLAPVKVTYEDDKFVFRLATTGQVVCRFAIMALPETMSLVQTLRAAATGEFLYAIRYDGIDLIFEEFDSRVHSTMFHFDVGEVDVASLFGEATDGGNTDKKE